MTRERRFHFGGTEPLARDFDHVVTASENVPQTIVVNRAKIAVNPHVRKTRPIRVEITLVVVPKTARHPNPRFANDQFADAPAHRISVFVHHIRVHSRQRSGKRARFFGREKIAHQNAARDFGAARIIDDRQLSVANGVEKPKPRRRIPRLAR